WVAGLRNVQYHLTTTVPDVVEVMNGSVESGPMWMRPFFIAGVSGLGPVVYEAVEFTVPVGGGYTFESVLPPGNNNFTFLYQGGFDPNQPLVNLLDYGLGNGNAPNGTPQGTSLIEAMLFEGVTYTYVTSQFDRFNPGTTYTTTITGPALISVTVPCPADLDGDGNVGPADLGALLGAWGTNDPAADLDGSGTVGSEDLGALLGSWGPCDA
ncbi:MAG: hypothetical protein VYC34_03280, partial [Planctomycetota bacterium]|nr:hypothetical protein [Planctomycetota bacterium]